MRFQLEFKEDTLCDMISSVWTPTESLKWCQSVGAVEAHEERRLNNVGVHFRKKDRAQDHTCLVCSERIWQWNNISPDSERPCSHDTHVPKTTIRRKDCKSYFFLINIGICSLTPTRVSTKHGLHHWPTIWLTFGLLVVYHWFPVVQLWQREY